MKNNKEIKKVSICKMEDKTVEIFKAMFGGMKDYGSSNDYSMQKMKAFMGYAYLQKIMEIFDGNVDEYIYEQLGETIEKLSRFGVPYELIYPSTYFMSTMNKFMANPELALKYANKVLSAGSVSYHQMDATMICGNALLKAGLYKEALELYEDSTRHAPSDKSFIEPNAGILNALLGMGDIPKALKFAQEKEVIFKPVIKLLIDKIGNQEIALDIVLPYLGLNGIEALLPSCIDQVVNPDDFVDLLGIVETDNAITEYYY